MNQTSNQFFQFPLSERTNCNAILSRLCPHRSALSVSSIGTNELQRSAPRTFPPTRVRFQFPLSERTNCNREIVALDVAHAGFQFPLSERTNCNSGKNIRECGGVEIFQFPLSERTNCNPLVRTRVQIHHVNFQFPLSERTNCNETALRLHSTDAGLSVSSIGTNELQRTSVCPTFDACDAFSFLYRNERTATVFPHHEIKRAPVFQFPLSERTNCNRDRLRRCRICPRSFSFLYRNERTATFQRHGDRRSVGTTFSFLYRNERTATQIEYIASATVAPFQFPLSERTNCNPP